MKKRWVTWAGTTAALVALAVAVGGGASAAPTRTHVDKVTLQLKWVPQAQFAGYYAALRKGFYNRAGLSVSIKPGGPDIVPEQVVASGQAQFGIDWLPSLLSARDKGTDLVNVAQVFARSGMTQLTWKSSGIDSIAKMKGKKVGNWLGGNEFELFAALTKNGINPQNKDDVEIVQQPFDMNLFLQKQIDSASAMTYNELAQVLEAKDDGGKLHTLGELNVIKMQDVGTGMLEDGIFSTEAWLKDKKHQDIAVRFIKASLQGWIYCRDHWRDCVNITLAAGPTLPRGHQTWQMNEINKLVWPAGPKGVGVMNAAAFSQTARIAQQFGVITKPPTGAYRTDLATKAVAQLKKAKVDFVGKKWRAATVAVSEGGK